MKKEIQKKRVLIVEDDQNLLNTLADIFIDEKMEVLKAENGEEGLALALKEKPDLLIVDIIIPKMDGLEMLRKVRESEWGHNASVMVLTNIGDADKLAEALEIGVDEYLLKSEWKLEDVIAKAKRVMGIV